MHLSSKVKCQDDNDYHPCKRSFGFYKSIMRATVTCETNPDDYISPYTKRFKCATIQRTHRVTSSTTFKHNIKCEMKYAAEVNQNDSTFLITKDNDEYTGSPCGEPIVKRIPALKRMTSTCNSETFPEVEYQQLFKCQTIWGSITLTNGTKFPLGMGCEARFKHDCRNKHPDCKLNTIVSRRNKKQYQRKMLIQG